MARVVDKAEVSYEVSVTLTEREINALTTVFQWGPKKCAEAILQLVGKTESDRIGEDLIGLFTSLYHPLNDVVLRGAHARAAFDNVSA